MIILCEASSTFQATSFQKEHFVGGFLNFSLQLASETSISCEASSTFQATKASKRSISWEASSTFQRTRLSKGAFRGRLPQLFNQGASKVLRLPRKTRKWPFTLKVWSAKRSISCETSFKFHTFNLKIDDFVWVFLIKSFLQSWKKYDFCEASASFHDTHQMLRLPRYLQGCHVRACLP